MARQRGIEFLLTMEEWVTIWRESGHLHERGRGRGKYVMARYGDQGPYAVGNVKIITHSENCSEGMRGNKSRLGKLHTAETKAKISAKCRITNRGRVPWNKGRPHSDIHRAKLSAAQKLRRLREARLQ
jgi:hypothetical protein